MHGEMDERTAESERAGERRHVRTKGSGHWITSSKIVFFSPKEKVVVFSCGLCGTKFFFSRCW